MKDFDEDIFPINKMIERRFCFADWIHFSALRRQYNQREQAKDYIEDREGNFYVADTRISRDHLPGF